MRRKNADKQLKERIEKGAVEKRDVTRRLAELAFGRANDCVRLVLETEPGLEKLDLSLLSEVKRSDKGAVEVKLVDRLQALELLAQVAREDTSELAVFLRSLQGGEEA